MSEIYTKRGKLSAYGLACGYVERKNINGKNVMLSKLHNIYLVQWHIVATNEHKEQGFDTLAKARQFYNNVK